jgi:hypothetical protein
MFGTPKVSLLLCTVSLVTPMLCVPFSKSLVSRDSTTAPTVKVLNGTYSGVYSSEYDQDFFLGIPILNLPLETFASAKLNR